MISVIESRPSALPQWRFPVPEGRRFMVINGDDFGFSQGVNRAIVQAHQQGILTSTSLMVTGAACEEAVALAQAHPQLGVGLHLVLGCGRSVLPPEQIPHLVDASGHFLADAAQAGLRYQWSAAAQRELRLEIRAQLEAFQQTGLPLSHVDGHLHLLSHPVVLRLLLELAEEFQIRVIRLPSEELRPALTFDRRHWITKGVWATVFGLLRRHGERLLAQQSIWTADRVYGLLQTGQVTEDYLLQLIPQIRADVVEIYAHPALPLADEPLNGPAGAGALELQAFTSQSVRLALQRSGFELTNYRTLSDNVLRVVNAS